MKVVPRETAVRDLARSGNTPQEAVNTALLDFFTLLTSRVPAA
jgi:hypothetical protein